VFLEDYDMALAENLVQGVDVWINTPRRPWEASGTSGMKVLVNGGLNLSIRDGWWDEWFDGENGWEIPTAEVTSEEGQALQGSIRQNLDRSIAEDMAALFTATVGQQAGIALDQAVIDAVNTQLGN
jgi:glucan phosphorylase